MANAETTLDDPVIEGVLGCISDRGEGDYDDVAAWVNEIGPDRFYEILRDSSGDVREYFTAQAAAGASFDDQEFASAIPFDTSDPDDEGMEIDFFWQEYVGPAVDRVSNAYAAARG
jgi:hypothetical protein